MAFIYLGETIKKIRNILKTIKVLQIPQNLRVLIFGGALNTKCYRETILDKLKDKNEFLTVVPDKINYFDISSEEYDLIAKETQLFENSDTLIIIPESAGSFAEIGMIASMISASPLRIKKKYAKKILIILNKKFKHDESFLKLGPIKIIKNFGGKVINIDFEKDEFYKIETQFETYKEDKKKSFKSTEKDELFFINSIKILMYIYYNKTLSYIENHYKTSLIEDLKEIHASISFDNIEYLESTGLIIKENLEGHIILKVNHSHAFINDLIELNFEFFMSKKIIYNFLKQSGY